MVAPFTLDSLMPPVSGAVAVSESPDPDQKGRGRHAATRRKRWSVGRTVLVLALVAILAAAASVVARLRAPAATATVTSSLSPTVTVASNPVTLPWAAVGQSAISIPSIGVAMKSGPEVPVPIASMTKIMTAYVILEDHPITVGQDGPNITMTPADVADYDNDTSTDQANAAITTGEVLTERQMLEGMLVHSANDFADALATWDAGSIPAFVTKMNAVAVQMGMTNTHYADASGYEAQSQSTASDVLIIAARAMTNPTFASIVRMKTLTLPVAGVLPSYTPLLGFIGVEGIKSGFTSMAGGCDVLAVTRMVHGQPVLLLAAVTGQTGTDQPNVLLAAGGAALNLVNDVYFKLGTQQVVQAGSTVAHATVYGHTVDAVAQSSANVLAWPGVKVDRVFVATHHLAAGAQRGTVVGSLVVAVGSHHSSVPVRLRSDLPQGTLLQRIF